MQQQTPCVASHQSIKRHSQNSLKDGETLLFLLAKTNQQLLCAAHLPRLSLQRDGSLYVLTGEETSFVTTMLPVAGPSEADIGMGTGGPKCLVRNCYSPAFGRTVHMAGCAPMLITK